MRMLPRLMLALVLLAPAGCGSLLPPPSPPPHLYHLTPLAPPAVAPAQLPAQLLVDVPAAPAALDTARIALSRSPISVDYFADAAWTDRAPLMVQSLLVESLSNAGQIAAVARDTLSLRADALLMTDLVDFEAEYHGAGAPVVRVQIDCRLVREPDRSILATRSFTATVPAAENEVPAIVDAFDAAFHAALVQIAPWSADHLATLGH